MENLCVDNARLMKSTKSVPHLLGKNKYHSIHDKRDDVMALNYKFVPESCSWNRQIMF